MSDLSAHILQTSEISTILTFAQRTSADDCQLADGDFITALARCSDAEYLKQRYVCLIATEQDQVVGMIAVKIPRLDAKFGRIVHSTCLPERNEQISQVIAFMLAGLEAHLIGQGWHMISIEIKPENAASQALVEAAGYSTGQVRNIYFKHLIRPEARPENGHAML